MRLLVTVLILSASLFSQTRAGLDRKYGPSEGGRYKVRPTIAVEATFWESGRVETLRIVPNDENGKKAAMRAEDVRNVSRELVPGRMCRYALKTTKMKLSCPPWKNCRGFQEEWKGATSLMVWYKDSVAYNLITLSDELIPPPGHMKLLSGYEHVPGCGFDTLTGSIEGDIDIHYDIGMFAGNHARRYANSATTEWIKSEHFGRESVLIVLTKQKRIVATFEKAVANFYAEVSSESQIEDFLKMVLTYPPGRN